MYSIVLIVATMAVALVWIVVLGDSRFSFHFVVARAAIDLFNLLSTAAVFRGTRTARVFVKRSSGHSSTTRGGIFGRTWAARIVFVLLSRHTSCRSCCIAAPCFASSVCRRTGTVAVQAVGSFVMGLSFSPSAATTPCVGAAFPFNFSASFAYRVRQRRVKVPFPAPGVGQVYRR